MKVGLMLKSRTLLSVALAGLALVVVTGPVAAHSGDGDTHRGKVGRHAFRDSDTRPGARCIYGEVTPADEASVSGVDMELVGVSVRPPKVGARNRSFRLDRQLVAWRFLLQERLGAGEWTTVERSRVQVRRASDVRPARFSRLAVRYDGNPEADYRVKAKAFWLKKRNPLRRIGVATHLVQYYKVRDAVLEWSCPGTPPAEAP